MSSTADRAYLEHILEAINKIRVSAAGGQAVFLADEDAYDASLRRLHTIAESTQRLSAELKAHQPEVPWDALAGFRNRIVHAYMDVDPALIWRFIESDLEALRQLAENELSADQ